MADGLGSWSVKADEEGAVWKREADEGGEEGGVASEVGFVCLSVVRGEVGRLVVVLCLLFSSGIPRICASPWSRGRNCRSDCDTTGLDMSGLHGTNVMNHQRRAARVRVKKGMLVFC